MKMLAGIVLVLLVVAAVVTYVVLKDDLRWKLPAEASVPDRPVGFGYKTVWLAVKTTDTKAVADFFGDPKAQPCNWKMGIARAHALTVQQFAFVTSPIDGWTLVVGWQLPSADAKGSEEAVVRLIDRLSADFGEAQWFASQRVVDYHGWAKSISGRTTRHYSYVGDKGETLYDEGEPTPVEPSGLYDSRGPEQGDPFFATEDTVMRIAAAWSIDPTTLQDRDLPASLGMLLRPRGIQ